MNLRLDVSAVFRWHTCTITKPTSVDRRLQADLGHRGEVRRANMNGLATRFVSFAAVGAVGTTVHYAMLVLLVGGIGVPAAAAAGLGAFAGAVVNCRREPRTWSTAYAHAGRTRSELGHFRSGCSEAWEGGSGPRITVMDTEKPHGMSEEDPLHYLSSL
jgi:hypothetical protein